MEKELKQNFIELPLSTFKKKHYPIPHYLFQTKFQKNQKNLQEIKKLIESQEYQYLGQVSDQRNLYCCKQKTNDKLVMIEIKQVGLKNNKSIYLSINLTSALKKYIRKYFMLKNWKIMDKIYIQDEKGQSSLVLLQYNFVETDLRNFIRRQYELDDRPKSSQITQICQEIIENLCEYHLESAVLLDIRPEMIMCEEGKWFLLPGDNAVTNKITQFGASISKVVGFRPVSSIYLSPAIYESFVKNQTAIIHNPYKSDVYSLGLVVWQLLMIRIVDQHQIKQKFEHRKEYHVAEIKNDFFHVRQKIRIQNNYGSRTPNALKMMLEDVQEHRSYIIEVCLGINFTSTLFSRIIVPFEKFFKKQVIDINPTRKRIQYPHAGMEYEGETIIVGDQLVKHGRGTIIYNSIKVFDGQWRNNLPHGKCSCSFSQIWSYEGMMEKGKLHGQGVLSFNGLRISGTKWNQNINEETTLAMVKNPLSGYYLICPDFKAQGEEIKKNTSQKVSGASQFSASFLNETSLSFNHLNEGMVNNPRKNSYYKSILEKDYKIYFDEQGNSKSKFTFNFTQIPADEIGRTMQILLSRRFFLAIVPFQVSLYEKVKYEKYHSGKCFDMIRLGIDPREVQGTHCYYTPNERQKKCFPHFQFSASCQNTETYYIQLIVSTGISAIVLQCLLYHLSLIEGYVLPVLDLSDCGIDDDQLRDIVLCGIKFQSVDLSNCNNLTDLGIRYLVQCSNIQLTIKEINISGVKLSNQALQQFKYCEWLKRLKVLKLSYCPKFTNDKIVQFLCDQRLAALETLEIAALNINHRGLEKIIAHGHLNSLKRLNVGSCHQFTQANLTQFIKSQQLVNLKIFECSSTTMKDTFLESLCEFEFSDSQVPLLTSLNISGSINLSVYGISKFLLCKSSKNLLSLNLSNLDLNDDFVELLAKKNLLSPNLTELNLSSCFKITDKGIKELLKPQRLVNLKKLDLSKTNVSNDTLLLLAQSNSRKLSHLKAFKCSKMNDTGFEKFLLSPVISYVKKLQIGGTSIKETFFSILASQKSDFSLQQLYLNECTEINERAFCQFLSSKRVREIRLVDISSTRFTNKVIQALNKNPFLKCHLLHLVTTNCVNPKGEELSYPPISASIEMNYQGSTQILKQSPQQLAKSQMLLKMTQFELSTEIPKIEKLFTSIYLFNLTKLHIKWQQCSLSLKSLAQSKVLNNLKDISLLGSKFSEQSLLQLIKSPTIKSMENLNLSWTDITNSTLNALSTSTYLFSLRNLNLSKCSSFNDKGLIKFLQSGKVMFLACLDLRSTLITNASIEALAKAKSLKSLTKLILRSCPNISEVGFKQYFASGVCSTLKQLDVGWTRVQGNLFSFISKSKTLQLNSLKIAGLKKVEFEFVKFLQTMGSSMIQQLELNFTQITLTTIQTLAQSKYIQSLEKLQLLGFDFVGNQQKAYSLIKFLQSMNLSKITNLKLTFVNCSEKLYLKIFDAIQNNLHVLEKLNLIGANSTVSQKAKKIFKKCQIITEE